MPGRLISACPSSAVQLFSILATLLILVTTPLGPCTCLAGVQVFGNQGFRNQVAKNQVAKNQVADNQVAENRVDNNRVEKRQVLESQSSRLPMEALQSRAAVWDHSGRPHTLGKAVERATSPRLDEAANPTTLPMPVQLIGIGNDGMLEVKAGDEQFRYSSDEFFEWGGFAEEPLFDQILLRDGSVLVAPVVSVDQTGVRIASRLWAETLLPAAAVQGIVFRAAGNRVERQRQLDEVAEARVLKTRIKTRRGDLVEGDLIAGQLEDKVHFRLGGQDASIRLDKVELIVFAGAMKVDRQVSLIGMRDGSRLSVQAISVDENRIRLRLGAFALQAATVTRGTSIWSRIVYYRPASQQYRFVSDKPPERIRDSQVLPWLTTKLDRATTGGPLHDGSRAFDRGLGTHAESQIVYRLDPGDRVFRATVCLDSSSNSRGQTSCRIVLLDSQNRWVVAEEPFEVGPSRGRLVEVAVTGFRAIGLVTGAGDHGITGDRVNWLNARVYRKQKPATD